MRLRASFHIQLTSLQEYIFPTQTFGNWGFLIIFFNYQFASVIRLYCRLSPQFSKNPLEPYKQWIAKFFDGTTSPTEQILRGVNSSEGLIWRVRYSDDTFPFLVRPGFCHVCVMTWPMCGFDQREFAYRAETPWSIPRSACVQRQHWRREMSIPKRRSQCNLANYGPKANSFPVRE